MPFLEVLHDVAHKAPSGLSCHQIAEGLGKRHSTLCSELNPGVATHKFAAVDLLPLMDLADSDAPLRFLAEKRGGVFVKLPRVGATGPVDTACIAAVKEFGDLMSTYGEALGDGKLQPHEREDVLREGHEALEAIMSLLKKVEAMEVSP